MNDKKLKFPIEIPCNGYVVKTDTHHTYFYGDSGYDEYECCIHCKVREEEERKYDESLCYVTVIHTIKFITGKENGIPFKRTIPDRTVKEFDPVKTIKETIKQHNEAIDFAKSLPPYTPQLEDRGDIFVFSAGTGGITLNHDVE